MEDPDPEDEDSDLEKGFVGALFDEIEDLRMQVSSRHPLIRCHP